MQKNNNNRRCTVALALLATLLLSACGSAARVHSPDQRIVLEFFVDAGGRPCYSVRFDGETVIEASSLGLEFTSLESPLGGLEMRAGGRRGRDTRWELPWGERRIVEDHHNEISVTFVSAQDGNQAFRMRARAFDDGIGFRYEVDGSGDTAIVAERTEFRIPEPATAFWQEGDGIVRYEHLYQTTSLREVDIAHTPMTVRLPSGVHLSIHEAALVDYAAFVLHRNGDVLKTRLRPWSDGDAVKTSRPFVSPWRTIQIADSAVGLINSSLILNLNEPNTLGDVSWVKPGKYVGIWWSMHLGAKTWEVGPNHGATTAEAKRYIDFAAIYGFDGVLVEGWNKGWHHDLNYTHAAEDFDLQAVAGYARQRGIHVIGHHETYGDVPRYEEQMEAGFDLLAAAGIPQVKTGYVADAGKLLRRGADGETVFEWHDGQYFIDHLMRNVRSAAVRKISINTHEPVKDTGLRRTYPNWLTREGSRGQEFAIWGETPNPPEHTVLLAYTRMLGGPMDFTPGMFNLHPRRGDTPRRVQTTLAKQLALYVVLYSPIQMVPDLRENYEARRDAFQFVVDVPTDWDRSIALAGEVGDYVVIARKQRGGDEWYLGAISDEQARSIALPLNFLDGASEYIAEIYSDADDAHWDHNPYGMKIQEQTLDKESTLELTLVAGGGTAIRFRPAEKAAQQ